MQAFRKLLDQLSSVVLIPVRSCLFRLEFHFKALLIKLYIHDCTKKTVNLIILVQKSSFLGVTKQSNEITSNE